MQKTIENSPKSVSFWKKYLDMSDYILKLSSSALHVWISICLAIWWLQTCYTRYLRVPWVPRLRVMFLKREPPNPSSCGSRWRRRSCFNLSWAFHEVRERWTDQRTSTKNLRNPSGPLKQHREVDHQKRCPREVESLRCFLESPLHQFFETQAFFGIGIQQTLEAVPDIHYCPCWKTGSCAGLKL